MNTRDLVGNPDQFYPTPKEAVDPLLPHLIEGRKRGDYRSVIDPCAGQGHLLWHLREVGFRHALGFELSSTIAAQRLATVQIGCADGLAELADPAMPRSYLIIANPPFSGDSWHVWARAMHRYQYALILLPNTVLSAASHIAVLDEVQGQPRFLRRRVAFTGSTPSWGCAWWDIGQDIAVPMEGVFL